MDRVFEAGLVLALERRHVSSRFAQHAISSKEVRPAKGHERFSVKHVFLGLVIFVLGLSLASIAFLCELLRLWIDMFK